VTVYTIGSMVWIAAALILFPFAYTPREDRRARLVRRALLVGLAVVIVLGVVAELLAVG
jgi:hypothetical protein